MANINTFSHHKKSGFLLLDSMIGILLISIFMLTVGHCMFAIIEHAHESALALQALHVASDHLDRCIHTRKLPLPETQSVDPFSLTWHCTPHTLPVLANVPRLQGKLPIFQAVSVTISFKTMRGAVRSQLLTGGFFAAEEQV